MKSWEELTIQDNYLFQKVLRENESLCRRLLERLIGITIAKINNLQTEKTINTDFRAKSVRLDVYAEDSNGRVYDIEMQAADMVEDELFLRTRYYQAMIDQGLLEKGQVYSRLRESVWGCVGTRFATAAMNDGIWYCPTRPCGFSSMPVGS